MFHSTILSIFMCVFVSPVDPLVYIISRLITFLFLLFIHSLELVDVASGVQQWSKSGTKTKKNSTILFLGPPLLFSFLKDFIVHCHFEWSMDFILDQSKWMAGHSFIHSHSIHLSDYLYLHLALKCIHLVEKTWHRFIHCIIISIDEWEMDCKKKI